MAALGNGVLQADAQTLGLLLLIQDILVGAERDQKHPCHIVSTVRRPQTIEVRCLMAAMCYTLLLALI